MFDEIRDFVVKNKIWVIICGIIFAVAGAVLAALISLYFLIAVAVGLIVVVASWFMKNKEIQDLEEYKKEARKRITKEYVQGLLKSVEEGKEINESYDMCSSLFKKNGFGVRGDDDALNIIKMHFDQITIEDISENPEIIMRANIEVLFEVLTGVKWSKAKYKHENTYGLAKELNFAAQGQGHHDFSKCFFEHTILCACALYKNLNLLELYTDENLTNEQEQQQKPLIQFYDWDKNHKHGSVLEQPNVQNIPVQDLLK